MIRLDFENIYDLIEMHYNAGENYVRTRPDAEIDSLYNNIRRLLILLPVVRDKNEFGWLKQFICANVDSLENWALNHKGVLNFDFFLKVYKSKFATIDKHVDSEGSYNAYTLLEHMNIHVCPYCEDEYFDEIDTDFGKRRTCDFDHFYPKDDYPGLAMCFFNLVPSGKGCNFIMNTHLVEANPYHPEIENWSKFISNLPVGSNYESLPIDEFTIDLLCSGKMVTNEGVLGLKQRYNNRRGEIRRILVNAQNNSDDRLAELERMGVPREWLESNRLAAMGVPYPQGKGHELHQKLRFDLTGY